MYIIISSLFTATRKAQQSLDWSTRMSPVAANDCVYLKCNCNFLQSWSSEFGEVTLLTSHQFQNRLAVIAKSALFSECKHVMFSI